LRRGDDQTRSRTYPRGRDRNSEEIAMLYLQSSFFSRAANLACRSSVGEWLSLVEHLVRDQGVGGSNPLSPTNYFNPVIELASFRFLQIPHLESTWV
jgi:hypothetical protein